MLKQSAILFKSSGGGRSKDGRFRHLLKIKSKGYHTIQSHLFFRPNNKTEINSNFKILKI